MPQTLDYGLWSQHSHTTTDWAQLSLQVTSWRPRYRPRNICLTRRIDEPGLREHLVANMRLQRRFDRDIHSSAQQGGEVKGGHAEGKASRLAQQASAAW